MLDTLIEKEQDGETHGLPTGNIVTKIIVEYFMSSFDRQLEEELSNTSVNFYRYVDDFYFGYNDPRELNEIKDALRKLTFKYGIYINDKKTKSITYKEMNNGSKLIDYFSQLDLSRKISVNKFVKIFNKFFVIANEEILNEVKGTDKLIFYSIQFFLNSLSKKAEITKEKEMQDLYIENLCNALKAIIYTNTDLEAPFILKLLQLTLNDAKVSSNFISMLETIQKIERRKDLKLQGIVTNYLRDELGSGVINKRLINRLIININQNYSEEAYFIFVLLQKLGICLTVHQLQLIFLKNQEEKKDKEKIDAQLDDLDDFNWIMLFKQVLINIDKNLGKSTDNRLMRQALYDPDIEKDDNGGLTIKYTDDGNRVEKYINRKRLTKLEKEVSTNDTELSLIVFQICDMLYEKNWCGSFARKHWLFRYEFMYSYYKGAHNFCNIVDNYCRENKEKNIFNKSIFESGPISKIDRFFIKLLSYDYSFSIQDNNYGK